MKTKKLYYEEEHGAFYHVIETNKTFVIEWVAKFNCDSQKTPLDQNVRWGKYLKVFKEKNRTHRLKSFDDNHILIYPFQAGQPFSLELATKKDIDKEIKSCEKWGVSSAYYQNLLKEVGT